MIGLADEMGFPRRATMDFADNRASAETSAIRFRAVLLDADKALLPGMSCRVRLATSEPYQALLVPERAIQEVRGKTAVLFVVGDKNTIEIRHVELGPRQPDAFHVVRTGLKTAERVVLGGFERLKPGSSVDPMETK